MNTQFNIRPVKIKDVESIYSLICQLENGKLDIVAFKKIYKSNIKNKNNIYYLAEIEGTIIGFISFHTQSLLHHCGLVGEIQEFYIEQNYRNKGIGKQLFAVVIKYANQQGLKSIEVTSNKNRIENIAVYENLGFKLTHNKFTIYKT